MAEPPGNAPVPARRRPLRTLCRAGGDPAEGDVDSPGLTLISRYFSDIATIF